MHIIQEEIGLPKVSVIKESENFSVFCIEPLPSGYGMTVGNSLRRVLLSSLPGTAIIAVRVENAKHEYSTLPGVKDSVLDLIINLKGVFFRKHTKGRETISLEKKGEGLVCAKDIVTSSDIEILNPDYVITNLSGKNASLKVDIIVEKSVGYSPAKERLQESELVEYIHVDALFSPVEKVKYEVEPTRVGERTNLDKVILEIGTNGAMTPHDSLKFSANLLISYFSIFNQENVVVEPEFMSDFSKTSASETEDVREAYTPIEILNLSPRTLNALINGEIGSIEQLQKCSEVKLQSMRGFGKKAMDEVQEALEKRGLSLHQE